MTQTSTKGRNILIVAVIVVVLVVAAIAFLIVFYQPSNANKQVTKLSVNVSINQTEVIQGNNLQAEVNVTTVGNPENITLGDIPNGFQFNFEPELGTSNFTSLLTMSIPVSTPTSNYSVIMTAAGRGMVQNASCVVSVLSANVTVSGRAFVNKMGSIVRQIKFTDEKTNVTSIFSFPTNPAAYQDNVYSVSLGK